MSLPAISLPNEQYRHGIGLVLGGLLGSAYAVISQIGDRIAIPGAPLYQPPFGPVGNIVLYALGASLLGLIAAWPPSGLSGTFLGAAVSAAAIVGSAYLAVDSTRSNIAAGVLTAIFVVLPFWGMLVPVLGALRWVVGHEEEAKRDRQRWRGRVLQPLTLVLAVGLVSLTSLYPEEARILIGQTNAMLQSAQSGASLPDPLTTTSFMARGQGPYELSWEHERIERYRIPRPGRNFDHHSVVVARFKNGWNLVCLYITLTDPPLCQDMEVIPR